MSEDLNNLYWLERFTFREDMIPNFLVKYKEKVLHTGKYLNVIREWGRDIKYSASEFEASFGQSDQADQIPSSSGSSSKDTNYQFEVYEHIDKAYQWSSKKLLEVIFNECSFSDRLDSIKHYFFMDRGDFFSHFVDGSEDMLEKASE